MSKAAIWDVIRACNYDSQAVEIELIMGRVDYHLPDGYSVRVYAQLITHEWWLKDRKLVTGY